MANQSAPVFVSPPSSSVPVTPSGTVEGDIWESPMVSGALSVVVVAVLILWIMNKTGISIPGIGVPKRHMTNQRKQALRDVKSNYINFLKRHGTSTNQSLFYGVNKIGALQRIGERPYSIKLSVKEFDKKKQKEIFKQDSKPTKGSFVIFEIRRFRFISKFISRWNDIYVIDRKFLPENLSNNVINIKVDVAFDVYFGVWISKGLVEAIEIEQNMWKYQNELILSSLPVWAENIASTNTKTANDSAIISKEAEVEAIKREKYVKNF